MSKTTVYSMYWDVGAHVPFCQNIYDSLWYAATQGMISCQFFLGNPKSFKRQRVTLADISKCKKLLERFPINVFSHFPYTVNLNGSVKSLAWAGDNVQDTKTNHMLKELEYELSILANFNGGVVIHPGCYPDRPKGLDTIAKSINKINFVENSKLLLENCAGEGRKLCKDFYEIKRIIDGIDENKKQNIGVCVDTAHIWGQGDYDLRECKEVDRLFSEFSNIIGMEYFTLLHLNDSKVPLGSKKDLYLLFLGRILCPPLLLSLHLCHMIFSFLPPPYNIVIPFRSSLRLKFSRNRNKHKSMHSFRFLVKLTGRPSLSLIVLYPIFINLSIALNQ